MFPDLWHLRSMPRSLYVCIVWQLLVPIVLAPHCVQGELPCTYMYVCSTCMYVHVLFMYSYMYCSCIRTCTVHVFVHVLFMYSYMFLKNCSSHPTKASPSHGGSLRAQPDFGLTALYIVDLVSARTHVWMGHECAQMLAL